MKPFCSVSLMLWAAFSLPVFAATPQEYDQALGKVQAALTRQAQAIRVEEVPTGEAPSLVARQVLAPLHSIQRPGSAPQPVETKALVASVAAAEAIHNPDQKAAAFEALDGQIRALREEIVPSGGAAPRCPNPAATTQSARAVLAGTEFASDPLPPPTWAERLADWLDRTLSRLFRPRTPARNINAPNINAKLILDIITAILIVAGVGTFAVLVAIIVQAIGRRGARTKPLALDEEEATLVEARDNDSLLALAEQQAKEGDYRRAFRLVYLAALVSLDTGGVLRFDRSKTNWEYLRALRTTGRGDVYQAMTPLTREFDQVWYGFARTDASHYARALAQYRALQAVPQSAVVA